MFRPPLLDSPLDIATLSLTCFLLLLSAVSLFFIFHLRTKSLSAPHLLDFTTLWTVKLILVSLIVLWSTAEILRVQLFRRDRRFPLPLQARALTLSLQAELCKVQVIASLGFLEPAFLLTVLFLLRASIRQRKAEGRRTAVKILFVCLPLTSLQAFFAFFPPVNDRFPQVLSLTSALLQETGGRQTVLCVYPLLGTAVFAVFAIGYCFCFMVSYWKVVSLVINKNLRARIYALGLSVLLPLPVQLLLLVLSVFWSPEQPTYAGIEFGVFFGALVCAVAGETILIIAPTTDAISAGGDSHRWIPGHQPRPLEWPDPS